MWLLDEEEPTPSRQGDISEQFTSAAATIQTPSQSVPCPPSWFGEIVLISSRLCQQGVLAAINERTRGCRAAASVTRRRSTSSRPRSRYAISGERTLEVFYEALRPFAAPFMALFGRDRLPAHSTLARFLAASTPEPVEDLLARPLVKEEPSAGRGIGKATSGRSLTGRAKPQGLGTCPKAKNCLSRRGDWKNCALLSTPGASAPAPRRARGSRGWTGRMVRELASRRRCL